MAIFNLFSKRQKQLEGTQDVYQYDIVPDKLRVQVVHIITDALGEDSGYGQSSSAESYTFLHDTLCREYGLFTLPKKFRENDRGAFLNFIFEETDSLKVIDAIELSFRLIASINSMEHYFAQTKMTPDEAIEELNERFKENSFGYQFENKILIRIDSTFAHSEIIKPTISLLSNTKFKGANDEYLKAHEHYRHGRNKECLSECLKSFESTMKIICKTKGWKFDNTDTAKKLIQVCFQNQLVPTYTQNQYTSLQNLLESGIPTIRNKLGGHGQGETIQTVDDSMARYALNLTGTTIIFLIEQSNIR